MWKDFKAPVAVIAFVVTLGVAMAGYSLYNRYLIEKPVQEEMSRVPGVQEVEKFRIRRAVGQVVRQSLRGRRGLNDGCGHSRRRQRRYLDS